MAARREIIREGETLKWRGHRYMPAATADMYEELNKIAVEMSAMTHQANTLAEEFAERRRAAPARRPGLLAPLFAFMWRVATFIFLSAVVGVGAMFPASLAVSFTHSGVMGLLFYVATLAFVAFIVLKVARWAK